MIRSMVISPWHGDGTEDGPMVGRVAVDYALATYRDATDDAPTPPAAGFMVASITLDDAQFAALEADADYHVLWDEPNPRPPDAMPPASEWGQLRSFLARQGISQAQIRAAIGQNINGRSRAQIASQLVAWLHGGGR